MLLLGHGAGTDHSMRINQVFYVTQKWLKWLCFVGFGGWFSGKWEGRVSWLALIAAVHLEVILRFVSLQSGPPSPSWNWDCMSNYLQSENSKASEKQTNKKETNQELMAGSKTPEVIWNLYTIKCKVDIPDFDLQLNKTDVGPARLNTR